MMANRSPLQVWPLVSLFLLPACASPPPDQATAKEEIDRLIEHTVEAGEGLTHFRGTMEQYDVSWRPPGAPPLDSLGEQRYATYQRWPQPNGATILYDHVRGLYEYGPSDTWTWLQRIGGDGHVNVSFTSDTASYRFLTRFPDSISRTVVGEDSGRPGRFSIFAWKASQLRREVGRARSIEHRGRELTQGTLCDVIDLVLGPVVVEEEGRSEPEGSVISYYVGATDGLIRRYTITRPPNGETGAVEYRELLFMVDATFVPSDIGYPRFSRAVRELMGGRLPRIVTDGS